MNWANSISQCKIDNLHISTNDFDMKFEDIIFKSVNDFYHLEYSVNWRSKFVQMTILFLDFPEIISKSGRKVDLNKLVERLSNYLVLFDQHFSDDLIEVYSTIKKGGINITGTSKTESKSMPVSERMAGLTTMIYAIVRNVANPAKTSFLKDVL